MRAERVGLLHPGLLLRPLFLGPVLFTLALIACRPVLTETSDLGLRRLEGNVMTGIGGFHEVEIDVGDEEALSVTVRSDTPGSRVYVRRLIDPDGAVAFRAEDWFAPNDEQKTNAGLLAPVTTLNWPVLATDFLLVPGKWSAVVGLADANQNLVQGEVSIDILLKDDTDLFRGRVRVVLVRPVTLDFSTQSALQQAKREWVEMFDQLGVGIIFDEIPTSFLGLLPPTTGDERYVELAQINGIRTVSVVLTDAIDAPELGFGGGVSQIAGLSGGIPGALVPTPHSAVQVSLLAAMGPDGRFDDEEIRLFAETMAHETGHFLGLFHPVEALTADEPWVTFDAIDDTPRCPTQSSCLRDLSENLMFPFPVCEPGGNCLRQDQLSAGQVAVMQRNVAVD